MAFPRTPVFFILFALACNRHQTEEPQPFDAGQWEYFPAALGRSVVYQMDSLVFDPAPGGNTAMLVSSSWLKEEWTDTIRDNTGQLLFVVERYERKSVTDPWQPKDVVAAARSNGQAVWTEQNLRFLKMLFPMDRRSNWNGNLWIDENREIEIAGERLRPFTNWFYQVDSIDVPMQIGLFHFDSTLVIREADDVNLIEKRYSRVCYAKHVGLAQKEQWILDSQYCNQLQAPPDCTTKPWEQKAEKGYILRQTLVEYR